MSHKQQSASNEPIQAYATMAKSRTIAVPKRNKISFESVGKAVKKARKQAGKRTAKRATAK